MIRINLHPLRAKKTKVPVRHFILAYLSTVVRLMALISAEVPAEKIWLERLVQSSNSMTLDGVALSNEAVAEFMRNLESSSYVVKGTVNLTHSRQAVMSNMKLREFQLTYQFVRFSQLPKSPKKEGS